MLGGVYAAAAVVVVVTWAVSRGGERGRPEVKSEGLAVRKRARGSVLTVVEQLTAWPQQKQAATIPLGLQGVLNRSSREFAGRWWASQAARLATAVEHSWHFPLYRLACLTRPKPRFSNRPFFFSTSPALQTLLNGSPTASHGEGCFRAGVEENRPMAGRPTWINSF